MFSDFELPNIKLSQNPMMCQVHFDCHHQVKWELMSLDQMWPEFERKNKSGWIQDGQIQDGRIQNGSHYQVKWEWMSLSQIELVWVRVGVEERVFLSESERRKQGVWIQDGSVWIQHGSRFKMAAIIKLSQNEWVKFFIVQIVGTNLGKCEWVWEEKLRWLNARYQNSRWLPSSS